jgi:hypothetical protein
MNLYQVISISYFYHTRGEISRLPAVYEDHPERELPWTTYAFQKTSSAAPNNSEIWVHLLRTTPPATVLAVLGSNPGGGGRDFPHLFRPVLGPSQPPTHTMGTESLSRGYSSRGVALNTHPHLTPRLKKSRAIPLLPLLAFVPCCNLHFTLTATTVHNTKTVNGNVHDFPWPIM